MAKTKFQFRIGIEAHSQTEANQKMKALAKLASQLDGKTLEAVSTKVPQILADPATASTIKSYLGL